MSLQGESHGKDCPLAAAEKRKKVNEMQKTNNLVDDRENDKPICEFCGETGGHPDEREDVAHTVAAKIARKTSMATTSSKV